MHVHAPARSPYRQHTWRSPFAIALAISASGAACVSGSEPNGNLEFRDGCDGAEEYIDENGEEVICVYTDDFGGGGDDSNGDDSNGDPCWTFPWLCDPTWGDDDGGDDGADDGGDGGEGGVPECPTNTVQAEAFFTPSSGTPGTPGLIALLATLPDPGGTTPFDLWRAAQLAPLLAPFLADGCPPPSGLMLCSWQPDGTIRCRFTVMPYVAPECSDTQPCTATGAQCIGGQCIVDLCAGVTCDDARYCDPALGQCVPIAPCTSNIDCPDQTICEYGQCVPGCRFNGDCDSPLVCVAGDCVQGCSSFLDCDDSTYCDETTAQCLPGCQYDQDCADGQYCASEGYPAIGQCQPGCWTSGECTPGNFCDPATHQCRPGCSILTPCQPSNYCQLDTGECIPGCQSVLDCDFGTQYCNAGQCAPGCGSDQDCPYPNVCQMGQCGPEGTPQSW